MGAVITIQILEQMGEHQKQVELFWGALYSPEGKGRADKRLADNPPEGLIGELKVLFQRVYFPPGGAFNFKGACKRLPGKPRKYASYVYLS